RKPWRGGAEDQHPFGKTIADCIGTQRGTSGAANFNADSGTFDFDVVDLHGGIAEQNADGEGHLRVGQNAEAAEARALDAFGDDSGSTAHGGGAKFGLTGDAGAQSDAILELHLLA